MNSPLSVSELSRDIKNTIERNFSYIFVKGEISNFKNHSSGHFYFSLKDSKSQISAVMWNSRVKDLIFTPEDGMNVLIKGRITLYETRGSYQIDVFEILPSGVGELQIAFEKLKNKLYEEGLFDDRYKKPLPLYPERIALITSETGAAFHDFIKVTENRYPLVKILLIPALMQGANSAVSICNAIIKANSSEYRSDIIVITRGGGAIEDLWTFNEEKVARAIFNSKIPVVSAIGHEVDFTISDFTADKRAPTPSAAAEMIFPDAYDLKLRLNVSENNLKRHIYYRINKLKNELNSIERNYYFKRPADLINEFRMNIDSIERDIKSVTERKIRNVKNNIDTSRKLLNSLNPENVLKRGFAIIKREDKIITQSRQLKTKDEIQIKFSDGQSDAIIK
ncbi:MAG: exodeoxyribonuclease VII large subunit [Ignavibacteria bacterium]|nr:exodeoxyribonuclease VII large subunit [Ignavibacteria bacterium]